MKFSEKLIILRKTNKFSQEDLADLLDVSRQSVSKWESGTTYPEMDKLLQMCKIFKCSLDELTNDEIKELGLGGKQKNNFSNLVDEGLDILKRSIQMFKNMQFLDYIKFFMGLTVILFLLYLFHLPFSYINNLTSNIFYGLGEKAGIILSNIFNFIIMASYLIISILLFIYIYKFKFLDEFDKKIVKEEPKPEEVKNDQVIKYVKQKENNSILKSFGSLFIFLIKLMAFFISLPFIGLLISLAGLLIISIFLLFKGVFYLGIILGIITLGLFVIMFLKLIYYFLYNKKINVKKVFILFIISLCGIGVSCGITAINVSNTSYLKEYSDLEQTTIRKEIKMTKDLIIGDLRKNHVDSFEFIIDETFKNTVIVEGQFNKDYVEYSIVQDESEVYPIPSIPAGISKTQVNLIIADLAKKQIRNYGLLDHIKMTIYTSSKNIETIKSNIDKKWEEEEKRREEENNIYVEINNLNDRIWQLEGTISEKDLEIEELEEKIKDYQNRIKDLLE